MASFTTELELQELPGGRWRVLRPLGYQGRTDAFEVPAGFETDLASVPRMLTWFVPRYGRYTKAAVLHDYLCRNPDVASRKDADGIFRRTMRELGVPVLRRWVMWTAVRLGKPGALLRSGPAQVLLALLWALPALAFLLAPTLVVVAWLTAAFVLEAAAFALHWVLGRKPNAPGWGLGA